jgi:phosphatidylglycerol---prolipoprotein diacylglyceryl transferase
MHPILFDLSHWKPLGISLDRFNARAAAFALSAVVAYVSALILGHRRWRRREQSWLRLAGDPVSLVAAALVALGLVGVLWAIGKGHSYGLMLAVGLLAATGVTTLLARRDHLPAQAVSAISLVALVAGILGARLAYVIEHWKDIAGPASAPYPWRTALLDAASIASGGLVFDGGLVLAVAAMLGYLAWRRLPIRRFLDVLAITAMIGLAFGRIGCFLNGCCYGGPCRENWPLAVHYPYASSPLVYPHADASPYPPGTLVSMVYVEQFKRHEGLQAPPALLLSLSEGQTLLKGPDILQTPEEFLAARRAYSAPVHPAQLYACACDLLLAGVLWLLWRRRKISGMVFAWLLVLYPVMRFGLEYIRHDNPDMRLTPAQYKCVILLALGIVFQIALRRGKAKAAEIGRASCRERVYRLV